MEKNYIKKYNIKRLYRKKSYALVILINQFSYIVTLNNRNKAKYVCY